MARVLGVAFCVLCLASTSVFAQINPLFLMGDFGENLMEMYPFGESGMGYWMYNSLLSRLNTLETNVRTGAYGGCESGVIGPFSSTQTSAAINFRGTFLTPPSISLSLSDLTTADASQVINIQIRPTEVTNTMATVQLTDANNNAAAVFVSYMACPSNAQSTATATSTSTTG